MFFSASTLLLLSLSIPYYLSSSISPAASIPFEESRGNTRIQQRPFFKKKKKQKTEAKHVSSNTPSYPPPWASSAPLQQCASTLFEAKKGGRKSGGVQQLRAQGYSTKMNRTELGWGWGGGGCRSLTRWEQHNLINTNARSKLFKRASNSALTCWRKATDGWTSQRRGDAITCGATAHTHAHSHTRRSKREGWCLWW